MKQTKEELDNWQKTLKWQFVAQKPRQTGPRVANFP
jgi:hypothetical protein